MRIEHWLIGHARKLATADISPAKLRNETRLHGKGLEAAARRMLNAWLSRIN